MDPILVGLLGIVVLFILIFFEMPIGFAMALVGFAGFVVVSGLKPAINMIGLVPYTHIASYTLSVMPLFLLMGNFASTSGMMTKTYYALNKWLGHLPGGLSMATIGGCAGFAAVCGSSVATAATMTRICLPEMRRYNYAPSLATGCLAAGGTLGILIPPSVHFILYGIIAEQSIGRLFIAGIIPGIILTTMFMLVIYFIAKLNPQAGPPAVKSSWKERFSALTKVWALIVLFVVVMGGIWGGVFTPTEAAAVGAVGAFVFLVASGGLNRGVLKESFLNTILVTGMSYGILIGAMILGYFIAVTGLPTELARFVSTLSIPPVGILVCILALYIVLGCLIETLAMILLTMPIFVPLILALGFDPIWFGVITCLMCELGLVTPPIGMNVFIIGGMAKDVPMYTIFKGVAPFVITMIVFVALLIAFPQIALFLPSTMMG